ncbi:MAG: hypothetical protein A2Y03_02645 [Omnitrophica WOR_2 bacterium GWF2_38_59]|nr:MAG: hypothetical protein A2Y03_02645 [Omnitrophica WOR_2 bacterium GWF2_38_59]OGX47216.1 MAG: hypothetical protein A2243_07005 [Omnitrophica WOR_2 bacterium RIFOXYA2_FULL_38_17]OGX50677.1 MAG: hypothetical protein A2267_06370 [Omnitrophica WOR_2 bacterium RIFOXYA12_FULL_38_10]OGX58948.1 MAG: hypothetical protein A2447_07280 [Omnitrophica WOR_2 bacterium RIFOXYC2_FULL_38_12]OGX59337.1 MAG: hypothetical protein A2306_01290 [Omnitrophica WOR_2 bacterium RIFOXYB2_FULL_38_16]HBG62338.1 hypothet
MQRKYLLIFVFCISLFVMGCSRRAPSPIFDGAYLKYKLDSEYLTVKFSKVNNKYFEIGFNFSNENMLVDNFVKTDQNDGKVLVDRFMKRRDGKLLMLKGVIGPVWLPENFRKKGSNEGIDLIFSAVQTDEMRKWKSVQVYAITASLFRGAISGTWYYDERSGFLVGCNAKTVISEFLSSGEDDPTLVLIETNITGVSLPSYGKVDGAIKPLPVKEANNAQGDSLGIEDIKIGGVVAYGDENVVLIGEDVYRVGDTINGMKIVSVSLNSIEVLDNGKVRTIK